MCGRPWTPHRIDRGGGVAPRSRDQTATAQDASRVTSESARLVRMIGTRAPSTMPAASAPGEEGQAFREHVSGFEIGHDQHIGAARHRRDDLFERGRRRADGIVERERAVEQGAGNLTAIGHLAQRRGLERGGNLALTVSIAQRIATRTSGAPKACARSMAFWTMSTFPRASGAILTAASVIISASGWPGTSMMKQWLMRRAVRIPRVPRHHCAHQLVGVQAAFHQRLGLSGAHQFHRASLLPGCEVRQRARSRRCRFLGPSIVRKGRRRTAVSEPVRDPIALPGQVEGDIANDALFVAHDTRYKPNPCGLSSIRQWL